MSSVVISALISAGTLVLSLIIVTFGTGRAYGEIRNDIKQIKTDLAKIEGMFVVRIRSEHIDRE